MLFYLLAALISTELHASPVLEWIDSPAAKPNIRMLIHDDDQKPQSFVAVQKVSGDERVTKAFAELEKRSEAIDELLPHRCFLNLRKDLKTRQTWCKSVSGENFIFVEGGPRIMQATKLRDVEREALEGHE